MRRPDVLQKGGRERGGKGGREEGRVLGTPEEMRQGGAGGGGGGNETNGRRGRRGERRETVSLAD